MQRFTRAVSVGNPREFVQAEQEDQQIAEACTRLIKNGTICWSYLYLARTFAEIDDLVQLEISPGDEPWLGDRVGAYQPVGGV